MHIRKVLIQGVEEQLLHVPAAPGDDVGLSAVFNLRGVGVGQYLHGVHIAHPQLVDGLVVVVDHLVDEAVDIRLAFLPVVCILHEGQVPRRIPFGHHEGAGAHGILEEFLLRPAAEILGQDAVGKVGQLGDEGRVGFFQRDDHRLFVGRLDGFHSRLQGQRALHVKVPLQGEHHVLRGHVGAVAELEAVPQHEGIDEAVVADGMGSGQPVRHHALGVEQHQRLEHLVDGEGVVHGDFPMQIEGGDGIRPGVNKGNGRVFRQGRGSRQERNRQGRNEGKDQKILFHGFLLFLFVL